MAFFRILFAFTDIRINVLKVCVTVCKMSRSASLVPYKRKHHPFKSKCLSFSYSSYYWRMYDVEFVWNKQFLLK